MVVEQHGQLVPVVALDGPFSPSLADDALTQGEGLDTGVAVAAVVSLSQLPQGPE